VSGGNQQQAIIAREADRRPDLLLAAQPTRGLHVGATAFIHQKLIAERDRAKAVWLIPYELDEILNVSDRIAVITDGKIVADLRPEETSERELGLFMAGSQTDKAGGEQ